MADHNVGLHVDALLSICRGPDWGDLWAAMGVHVQTFETLGISRSASDAAVWRACQSHDVVLLTANRNATREDSLEVTIRLEGTSQSLPVFTFADADRVLADRAYAFRVAERFIDLLLDVEQLRGSGRMFLP